MNDDRVFTYLICLAGGVIGFVIAVGGVVCILDKSYTFNEYLTDLANVWPYLAGAVVAALVRSMLRTRNGNHTDKGGG